jgi:Emfourin
MGGLGQPAHVIDDADKLELRRLVAAAAATPARPQATEQLRDAQTYEIEIEIEDHDKSSTLEATDGSVPKEFAELRD